MLHSQRVVWWIPFLLSCGLFCLSSEVLAQDRGLTAVAQAVTKNPTFNIGKQYAVIIGIDQYKDWPPLKNAVADAKDIRRILGERYFIDEFIELYDQQATSGAIRKLFSEVLPSKLTTLDSVLIYYAGHGYLDPSKTGFWIAADGQTDVYEQAGWIPNAQLRNYIGLLKAQRVLVIADACFSGDFLNVSRGASPTVDASYFQRALQLTARQALTSGASESVPDQSEFSSQLKNLLLRNSQALLDPFSMFERIRLGVTKTQPLLGTLPGNEQGASFVLFLRPSKGSLRVVVQTAADVVIDGKPFGRATSDSPLAVNDLEPGERKVSLRFADHTEELSSTVLSSATVSVESTYQPVKLGRLVLRGFPVGTAFFWGDRKLGIAASGEFAVPELAPGNGVITARYGPWSFAPSYPVRIVSGEVSVVKFAGGHIVLTGLPAGINVSIDGTPAARSGAGPELTLGPFPAGDYSLLLTGIDVQPLPLSVSVGTEGDSRPSFRLVSLVSASAPPSRASGVLSITSVPPGLRVQVDNLEEITTPASVELAPGTHRLMPMITAIDGVSYETQEQLISVTAGSSLLVSLSPTILTAEVSMLRFPEGSVVLVDGKAIPLSSSGRSSVQVGRRVFTVERPGTVPVTWNRLVGEAEISLVWGLNPDQAYRPPRRTIALDGKIDTWAAIAPVFDEAVPSLSIREPTFLNSAEAGMARVYLARDDRYLYWRIDFNAKNPYLTPPAGVKGRLSSLIAVQVKPGVSRFFMLDYDPRSKNGSTSTCIKDLATEKFSDWTENTVGYKQSASMMVQRAELSQILRFGPGPYLFSITLSESEWKNAISTPELYLDLTP